MDWELLYKILPYLITLAIGIFGGYWLIGKGKVAQLKVAIVLIHDAMEDDTITEAESRAIVAALTDLLGIN